MVHSTINNREFTNSITNLIGGDRMNDDTIIVRDIDVDTLAVQLEEEQAHNALVNSSICRVRRDRAEAAVVEAHIVDSNTWKHHIGRRVLMAVPCMYATLLLIASLS